MATDDGLQKGDKIEYVPHKHYAFQKDANGDRPWKLGIRRNTGRMVPNPDNPSTKIAEVETVPLEGIGIDLHLDYVKRHPNPQEEIQNVILMEPNKTWPGIVTDVSQDGTYSVDCLPGNGVTLHLHNVTFDSNKKTHHSCHRSSHTIKIGG